MSHLLRLKYLIMYRFNEDCTAEEAEWILNYCYRHGIKTGNFKFNRDVDELF